MIKAIESSEWETFLNAFTQRNRGRRARFRDIQPRRFCRRGTGGHLESVSADDHTVTVKRSYDKHGEQATMSDELENIRGISVQYDVDNSEDVLEFTNDKTS